MFKALPLRFAIIDSTLANLVGRMHYHTVSSIRPEAEKHAHKIDFRSRQHSIDMNTCYHHTIACILPENKCVWRYCTVYLTIVATTQATLNEPLSLNRS